MIVGIMQFLSFLIRLSLSVAALIIALVSISCTQKPTGHVVARVGDAVITEDAFVSELTDRAQRGQSVGTPEERESVLNDMIRLEILFAKAKAAGLDRDPEISRQYKRMLSGKFEETERKKRPPVAKPEEGEIELLYEQQRAQFTSPEKVHVAVLFVKVPSKAGVEQVESSRERVEELRQQAVAHRNTQSSFGLLAQQNSDDQATRYRGGDCGWLTHETTKVRWEAAVLHAMFDLEKPGDITQIIRTADGFYLGKLIERKAEAVAPLAKVRDRIERQLLAAESKRSQVEFDRSQRQGVDLSINQELLKTIELPALIAQKKEAKPPASPVR